jgi:hypothetical protein
MASWIQIFKFQITVPEPEPYYIIKTEGNFKKVNTTIKIIKINYLLPIVHILQHIFSFATKIASSIWILPDPLVTGLPDPGS